VLLASLAAALHGGEVVALLDAAGAFDPWAARRAGVPLERLLWVRAPEPNRGKKLLAAAEAIVAAGGFGLVALDLGERPPPVPTAAWLRLRRLAGPPATSVLVVAAQRLPGVLGASALALHEPRAMFDGGGASAAGALLIGVQTHARCERNLGGDRQAGPTLGLRHAL
jgi:hypothetical protein